MSNDIVRVILAITVGVHGIGHTLFLVSALGIADWGQSNHSWLIANEGLAKVIGGIIWLMVIIGFIAAAIGMFGQQAWWRMLATFVSLVSLVAFALFWENPPTQPVISAAIFNVVVLVAFWVFKWPPSTLIGP